MSPVSGAVTGQWRNGRYCVCVSMRDWGQSVVREAAAAERKRPGVGVQVGVQADAANLLHETSTSKNSENEPELRETDGSDGTDGFSCPSFFPRCKAENDGLIEDSALLPLFAQGSG
jgi:hypothetical protein